MRHIIFIFMLIPVFLSPVAQAHNCTAASEFIVNVPTLYTNPDLSELYGKLGDTYAAASKPLITCTNTDNIYSMKIEFFAAGYNNPNQAGPDGNQIFLGNISETSGIIYTLGADASCGTSAWVKPGSNVITLCSSDAFASVSPKVQFYQKNTGKDIDSSVMRTQMGTFWVRINNNTEYGVPVFFTAFNVMTPPCKVTTNSVSVPMGNINKSQFSGTASTAGGADFNISLQCTKAATVTLQIDPNGTSPGKPLGLIPTNTGLGTASGVAIQLLNNNTGDPFFLGKAVSMGHTPGGRYNMSLKARYMQIENSIASGAANGSATFTVRYQ